MIGVRDAAWSCAQKTRRAENEVKDEGGRSKTRVRLPGDSGGDLIGVKRRCGNHNGTVGSGELRVGNGQPWIPVLAGEAGCVE